MSWILNRLTRNHATRRFLSSEPELGQGVYTVAEAARILGRGPAGVSDRQVRYWVSTGLTPPSHRVENVDVLSFVDLISLELVRRFLREGVSLQAVRKLEARLKESYSWDRPLAHEVFFTDGASIWAEELGGEPGSVIEIVGRRRDHYVWVEGIATFAKEVRYAGEDRRAVAWSPHPGVLIDPSVQFGTPVVEGTRIPVQTIVANLTVGSPSEVAGWYGLDVRQVVNVRDYLVVA